MSASRTAALALLLLCTARVRAADHFIPGKRLALSDRGGRQRIVFTAKSPSIVLPATDPTSFGGSPLIHASFVPRYPGSGSDVAALVSVEATVGLPLFPANLPAPPAN